MFDRVVVVDWSANSAPKRGRDSIWLAVADGARAVVDDALVVDNVPTRAGAEARLIEVLEQHPTATSLVGVDFSLGYPTGTAAALGLHGVPWEATWQLLCNRICDDDRNRNNRFHVAAELNASMTGRPEPFWGCPPSKRAATLVSTKPMGDTDWRAVERLLIERGRRPFSSWQLLGAGAVGSQTLLGIPMLQRLLGHLGSRAQVWPFTTGLRAPTLEPGSVVFAEVWPTLAPDSAWEHPVRDARQVADTAHWLRVLDADGALRELLQPDLHSVTRSMVEREEGWVLGVPA